MTAVQITTTPAFFFLPPKTGQGIQQKSGSFKG
jgi:hypothetical protein